MRSTDFPFAVMPQRLQRGGRLTAAQREEQRRRQARSDLDTMFEDARYLGQGVKDAAGTVGRYVRSRVKEPGKLGSDVRGAGQMVVDTITEDPSGFVADALFAPFSGTRDFAEMRRMAREARAAGDNEAASMYEQAAVAAGASAIPVAGPLLARGLRGAGRALKAAPDAPPPRPAAPTFSVTPEETPGKNTMHRADIQSGSKQARARYQGGAPWQRDRQDVLYAARDVPTGTQTGTGAYINSASDLEMNPVNVTGLSLPDVESRLPEIEAIEKLRGLIDAQEGMAGNMPIPDEGGNALFFQTGRLPSEAEMAFLAKNTPAGFTTTATTGGATTLPFDPGMLGSEAQAATSDFRELARRYLKTEPVAARNLGFYTEPFDGAEPFSGTATMNVLNDFAKLDPSVASSIAESPEVRDVLRQKYLRDEGAPGTRGDIQNTRQFFSDPRWAQAVELIRRGMPPAAALAALGYSTGALADETPR